MVSGIREEIINILNQRPDGKEHEEFEIDMVCNAIEGLTDMILANIKAGDNEGSFIK